MAQTRRIKTLLRKLERYEHANYYPMFTEVNRDDDGFSLEFLNETSIPVFRAETLQDCINRAYEFLSQDKRCKERLEYLKAIGAEFSAWIPVPLSCEEDITIPELFER